jgi:hypothetical protein
MCFLHMHEYGTLKPVKVILRRVSRRRGRNNGRVKQVRYITHLYVNFTTKSLYDSYILIKMFFKKEAW